jgi:hypothetical protein
MQVLRLAALAQDGPSFFSLRMPVIFHNQDHGPFLRDDAPSFFSGRILVIFVAQDDVSFFTRRIAVHLC